MKNILFSLILLAFFFTILEVVFRVSFDMRSPGEEAEIEYQDDSVTLWTHKPDQCAVEGEKEIEYRINSRGFRCADFPQKKPEGEFRVLTIGDSVTLGYGVSEGDTYPRMLQNYLCKRLPDRSFRVINAGVNAYSTREELMFLRNNGIHLEADVVIVGFILNDISIQSRHHYLQRFGRERSPGFLRRGWMGFNTLMQHSYFIMSLRRAMRKVRPT